jgi:hypothetical protein
MAGLRIDHIVYATRDLDQAVSDLADRLRVSSSAGGRHVGVGTHNYLLGLADDAYLELIGPDPSQSVPAGQPLPFGIDALDRPKLAGFAVKAPDIDDVVARARAAGYDPGEVRGMQRATPDGRLLEWRLTLGGSHQGLVPFLIDWLDSPHPSGSAPGGCRLVSLRGEHPDHHAVRKANQALGVEFDVVQGPAPVLVATIDTPKGTIELR